MMNGLYRIADTTDDSLHSLLSEEFISREKFLKQRPKFIKLTSEGNRMIKKIKGGWRGQ